MSTDNSEVCCPRFDPEPWDGKTITWDRKSFVQDRVLSLFHIPLNYGAVMKRCIQAIEAKEAQTKERVILTDENSLWGADVYVETAKDIPDAKMAEISGTFFARVFEGPFSKIRQWITEMKTTLEAQGKNLNKMYFYYTTCPTCAKKYGKNYVAILAEI